MGFACSLLVVKDSNIRALVSRTTEFLTKTAVCDNCINTASTQLQRIAHFPVILMREKKLFTTYAKRGLTKFQMEAIFVSESVKERELLFYERFIKMRHSLGNVHNSFYCYAVTPCSEKNFQFPRREYKRFDSTLL